jgi:hypothetical protein
MLLETFEPSDPLFKPLPCDLTACGAVVRGPDGALGVHSEEQSHNA